MPQVATAGVLKAAAPALITGGLGLLSNRQSGTQKDLQRGQLNALNAQTALAGQLGDFAKKQYELSAPAYGRAMQYYQSLLGGNAAARQQALQPDIRRLNETYQGAEGSIQNRMIGAARDRELADLKRQQTAQIAELGAAPRAGAAATLLGAGQQGYSDLLAALGGQSAVNQNVLAGTQDAMLTESERRKQQANMAAGWLKTFMPQLIAAFSGKKIANTVASPSFARLQMGPEAPAASRPRFNVTFMRPK